MTRASFREHVFRILFRYEFYNNEEFEQQIPLYFMEYQELSEEERIEVINRVQAIEQQLTVIDKKLEENCVGWNTSRIGKPELAILRVAIYEILFDEKIDRAISINEAVVLSKNYCDEKAHSFVNGVLAKLDK